MADEQQTENVETTTTENVEREAQQEQAKKEFIKNDKGHQIDIDKVVGERLKRQERLIAEELGVESLDQAKAIMEANKKLEEEKAIEKGKFDEVIKKRTQEYNEKLSKLENELKNERIDKQLISAASKNNAINPDQIKELMKNSVHLNAEGKVEVLDKSGTPRYNKNGDPLTVEEAVQEFLTQNSHFQSATPSGSGSVSNVGKSNTNKTLNISDLDMSKPEDRKLYADYRRQRDSVTHIKLNK
jgi:predicted acylesterase/phospholipase RssA